MSRSWNLAKYHGEIELKAGEPIGRILVSRVESLFDPLIAAAAKDQQFFVLRINHPVFSNAECQSSIHKEINNTYRMSFTLLICTVGDFQFQSMIAAFQF